MSKVILINGSPNQQGCTYTGLREVEEVLKKHGIDTEIVWIGAEPIAGCNGCRACAHTGKCRHDDKVNYILDMLDDIDGIVVGSPVYYASANATLTAVLDRLFFSAHFDKRMKVGASVAVARRGGCSATFDQLNKYFTISGMPVASSQYWNSVHGGAPGEAVRDEEGMQTMRTLARNMAFLMKAIALGKEKYGLPEREKGIATNFIR